MCRCGNSVGRWESSRAINEVSVKRAPWVSFQVLDDVAAKYTNQRINDSKKMSILQRGRTEKKIHQVAADDKNEDVYEIDPVSV